MSWGNAEEPWPSRGRLLGGDWSGRLRGQWSEGEVLFPTVPKLGLPQKSKLKVPFELEGEEQQVGSGVWILFGMDGSRRHMYVTL